MHNAQNGGLHIYKRVQSVTHASSARHEQNKLKVVCMFDSVCANVVRSFA